MTLKDNVIKNIVGRVIRSQDYRIEVVNLINAEFLQFVIDFFKKIVDAKLNSKDITIDWYKNVFINENLPSDDIAINSGLNKKTISNMYRTTTKQVVIEASNEHFDSLYNSIKILVENENEIGEIQLKGEELNILKSDSFINSRNSSLKGACSGFYR